MTLPATAARSCHVTEEHRGHAAVAAVVAVVASAADDAILF